MSKDFSCGAIGCPHTRNGDFSDQLCSHCRRDYQESFERSALPLVEMMHKLASLHSSPLLDNEGNFIKSRWKDQKAAATYDNLREILESLKSSLYWSFVKGARLEKK